MTFSGTRRFAIGFFVVYAVAVVYPAVAAFRGPRPFVLGMPFAMAWTAAWVVAAFFVLLCLDHVYGRAERAHHTADRAPGPANRDGTDGEATAGSGPARAEP